MCIRDRGGVDRTQSLLAATLRLHLTIDEDRRKAMLFVVPDVCNLNKLSSWCLALSGGIAASPEYVTSGLKTGIALAFKAALQTPRRVGLTDNFKRQLRIELFHQIVWGITITLMKSI